MAASVTPLGFERFRGVELSGPPLMWVEATSALHAMRWCGELRKRVRELERTLGRKTYELEILGKGFRTWQ